MSMGNEGLLTLTVNVKVSPETDSSVGTRNPFREVGSLHSLLHS